MYSRNPQRLFAERAVILLKIITWAQKHGVPVNQLTGEQIKLAITSRQ
jgi:DNA-binding transcriptional MerR regulator